jgi:hypothetical protein
MVVSRRATAADLDEREADHAASIRGPGTALLAHLEEVARTAGVTSAGSVPRATCVRGRGLSGPAGRRAGGDRAVPGVDRAAPEPQAGVLAIPPNPPRERRSGDGDGVSRVGRRADYLYYLALFGRSHPTVLASATRTPSARSRRLRGISSFAPRSRIEPPQPPPPALARSVRQGSGSRGGLGPLVLVE